MSIDTSTSLARDCWFLTGPTAAGKTRVGLEPNEAPWAGEDGGAGEFTLAGESGDAECIGGSAGEAANGGSAGARSWGTCARSRTLSFDFGRS